MQSFVCIQQMLCSNAMLFCRWYFCSCVFDVFQCFTLPFRSFFLCCSNAQSFLCTYILGLSLCSSDGILFSYVAMCWIIMMLFFCMLHCLFCFFFSCVQICWYFIMRSASFDATCPEFLCCCAFLILCGVVNAVLCTNMTVFAHLYLFIQCFFDWLTDLCSLSIALRSDAV